MTRYKKYLKSKGFTFNEDYDYLPWDNYHKQRETLEGCCAYISENNELVYVQCWDVCDIITYFGRNGEVIRQEFE